MINVASHFENADCAVLRNMTVVAGGESSQLPMEAILSFAGVHLLCLGYQQHRLRHDLLRRGKCLGGAGHGLGCQAHRQDPGDALRLCSAHGDPRGYATVAATAAGRYSLLPYGRPLGYLRCNLAGPG